MDEDQIPGQMTIDECIAEAMDDDCGVSPCFVNCGQPACRELGCIRVYNARKSAA